MQGTRNTCCGLLLQASSLENEKITIQVGLQHLQGGAARVAKLKPYNYALLVFNHF